MRTRSAAMAGLSAAMLTRCAWSSREEARSELQMQTTASGTATVSETAKILVARGMASVAAQLLSDRRPPSPNGELVGIVPGRAAKRQHEVRSGRPSYGPIIVAGQEPPAASFQSTLLA